MRKDIQIPEVKDIYIAAVLDFNEDFQTHDWNAYIINDGKQSIETVLIVAQGYDNKDMTAPMRHMIKVVPAKGFARIEFLDQSILRLDNFFNISYFQENKMFERRFEFPSNSIITDNAVNLPVINKKGVFAR